MIDVCFEESPWQTALDGIRPGGVMRAMSFLSLVEGEDEDTILEAFEALNEKKVRLDIEDLPMDAGSGQQAVRLKMEQELAQSGNLTEGLGENDTLRLYIEELAGTPCCPQEDILLEQLLAGDQEAASKLLPQKLSLVVELAKAYTGRGVLLMDLIQEGSLGLWQAILQYEGGDFGAHCRWWTEQYLAWAVFQQARSGGLGQKLRKGMEDYSAMDRKLLTQLGRNATMEEIADRMQIPLEEAEVYEDMIRQARERQRVDEALKPKKESQEDSQAVEDTAYFAQRQRILELLSVLPEEDAQLLSLRFGLEGGLPLDPEQTGEKLGLTPQEVVEREAQALAKLRQQGET